MCDAFMIEKAMRYNMKGKKYINALIKYYFTDIRLRNALLDFRQIEKNHNMGNTIFSELLYGGLVFSIAFVVSSSHHRHLSTPPNSLHTPYGPRAYFQQFAQGHHH